MLKKTVTKETEVADVALDFFIINLFVFIFKVSPFFLVFPFLPLNKKLLTVKYHTTLISNVLMEIIIFFQR